MKFFTARPSLGVLLAVALAIALGAPAVAHAQGQGQQPIAPRHQGFGIGAKIGPVFADFSSDVSDFSNRTGWAGGIFFGGNRTGDIGVMGELLYIKKATTDALGQHVDVHYLHIPILLRINVGSKRLDRVSAYFLIGPGADVKLKAELDGVDIAEQYEGLDLGLVIGGGIEVTRIFAEAKYIQGLRNVRGGNLADTEEIKTKTFILLVGIRFN